MKKVFRSAGFALVALFLVAAVVYAQMGVSSIPGGGWWSGEMIQNVGSDLANVVATAYGTGGTTYSASAALAANEAYNFEPSAFSGMPDGFIGAAIVSSDQPIKAIVNVTNRKAGDYGITGGEAAAQYQGIDGAAIATTLYFPMVKNDRYGKTTSFYIQNAGSGAATASCTFRMDNGASYSYTTPSINPSEMVVVTPSDAGVPTTQTDRANIGSLVVTSAQPLAGVVMEYVTNESPATLLQATRGFTAQDFDAKFYAPTVKQDRYGRFTGIQVQNVESSASVNVTLTLVGSRGDCAGQTYVRTYNGLGAGESHTFNQIAGQDGEMVNNCAASATIEATGGNIVAVVSESYVAGKIPAGQHQASTTYSAFPDKVASIKVSVPMFKENRYDKYTGLMVQNVGTADATNVVITFVGSKGPAAGNTYTTLPQTILQGGSIERSRNSENAGLWSGSVAPADSTYSLVITADQPIVVIANEAVYPGASLLQDKNNYEGFNLPGN